MSNILIIYWSFSMIRKFIITLITACFSFTAVSQTLIPANDDMFEQGNFWIWEYKNHLGEFSSLERYEVVAVKGDLITVEMATQYPGQDQFSAHHRFKFVLDDCLSAYEDLRKKPYWRLKGFYYKGPDQVWTKGSRGLNVQVFEEKFNCMQILDAANIQFEHKFTDRNLENVGAATLFQNSKVRPPRKVEYYSWYIFQPYKLGGIAGYKVFNPGKGDNEFTFELVEWNMSSR